MAKPTTTRTEKSSALLSELLLQVIKVLSRSLLFLSNLSSHPLFAIAATSSLLALLYVPRPLLHFIFSPVAISTLFLLAAALRRCSPPPELPSADPKSIIDVEVEKHRQNSILDDGVLDRSFCGGPLEAIYEEYEGEEEDGGCRSSPESSRGSKDANLRSRSARSLGFECMDSDTESDFSAPPPSPRKLFFRWDDDEDEEDEMIEIELEEENLIEIDISGDYR